MRPVDYNRFLGKKDLDVENLEKEILDNIRSTLHDVDMKPIIPYVQLHEFEALLFSDISAFEWVIEGWGTEAEHALYTIKQKFKNPEKINDNPHTAPSKRLDNIFDGLYSKVEHGPVIAEEIGLEKIREECPHFDRRLTKLEKLEM